MLKHYRGTSGYALLYLVVIFMVCLLTVVFGGLANALSVPNVSTIQGVVILAAIFIVGFILMNRFLQIEGRPATVAEANLVGLKSVGYLFACIFAIGLFALVIMVFSKILGMGGSGGPPGGAGAKDGAPDPEQAKKQIGMLMGVFGTMFMFYISPFLNLAVLSRLIGAKEN